jgi:ABC-type nickel/cobalt efflux system permease component RcnA
MLVLLAITTILNKKPNWFGHKHPHQHQDGTLHYDSHNHVDIDHKHNHKSYLIGCVHGLAGSGGLVVLTAATLDNVGTILGFILIFGIGSMIGMALISGLMGVPFALAKNSTSVCKIFRYAAGFLSLVIGANIIYQIAITDGFFGIKIL